MALAQRSFSARPAGPPLTRPQINPPPQTKTGGADKYFEFEPLDEKDTRPRWRLVGQTSGVRYAYADGEGDDSA